MPRWPFSFSQKSPATAEGATDSTRNPETAPTTRQAIRRIAFVAVVYLLVFVPGCALVRHWLPFPEVSMVREKIEHFIRHGDDYDIIFIGSSRVHSQVIPAIFDKIAAANGVPVKSYNAGIAGMVSPEDSYVLDQLLRVSHRRLRWVFLEVQRLRTVLEQEQTSRSAYWHDTTRFLLVARRLFGQAIENQAQLGKESTFSARCGVWTTMAGRLCGHARYWFMREINLGCGTEVLVRWLELPGSHEDNGRSSKEKDAGWSPSRGAIQQMVGEGRARYERAYADRLAEPAVKDRGDAVSQESLEHMLAAVAKAGAKAVLIIPPTPVARNFYPTVEREKELTILDFTDVHQNRELFIPEHRIDEDHINTTGAQFFTEDLARRFVELVKPHPQAP